MSENTETTKTTGVNLYESTIDEIAELIGNYGSRSAFIRDIVTGALDARRIAAEAGHPVPVHKMDEFLRDAARAYVEQQDEKG